jgi:hypothetical protein
MKELLLNDEFLPAVAEGTKTSTVRKGVRSIPLDYMRLQGSHDSVVVLVTGTKFVPFGELNDLDAQRDGFENIDELRRVITDIYGPLGDDEYMTIIEFARV